MKKFKVGDRVKFKEKDFLSNGVVKQVLKGGANFRAYIVKLDKKAPNEYAWNTDEVLELGADLELENA
jgi:hypothetical protein